MTDHFVTVEEVRGAMTPPDVTLCSCADVDLGLKTLVYQHSRAMFVVSCHRKVVCETPEINEAVESYNAAFHRSKRDVS